MDDVLDRICPIYNTRDLFGHILLVVSILLRDKNLVYPLGAVASNARLKLAVQKSRSPVVDFARKRDRRLDREDQTTRLFDVLATLYLGLSVRLAFVSSLGRQGPVVSWQSIKEESLAQ